jgi:hypothetical protein
MYGLRFWIEHYRNPKSKKHNLKSGKSTDQRMPPRRATACKRPSKFAWRRVTGEHKQGAVSTTTDTLRHEEAS